MRSISPRLRQRQVFTFAAGLALALGCGGGDGSTPPVTVSSVVILTPTGAPSFQTLGRTLQFTAEARAANASVIFGTALTWSSSNVAVATVNGTGLLTVMGNGTTEVRATATASGIQSVPVTVTVAQVASQTVVTPGVVGFGAIGSTRQLVAEARDSSSAPLPGVPTVVWTSAGPGTSASVSGTGLVTAVAVGAIDTAIATIGAFATKVPITVTQIVATLQVSSTGSDTLATTGRTKQYTATVLDSLANAIPGAALSWTSTAPDVATVGAGTGLATALADGNTNIRATSGAVFAQLPLTVRRFATVFTLDPSTANLATPAASQLFTSDARDSVDTVLPTTWLMRTPAIATSAPAAGSTTTVTASANGMTFLIRSAGTRADSAGITVSGQVTLPITASVEVGSFFFRSVLNATQNMAIDTVAVGGTVTWTWIPGPAQHNVQSILTPTFASSPFMTTGSYQVVFNGAGAYQYQCELHPEMTGRIVVR